MAFANLPPDLQAMFNNLQDQINKLLTGPNYATSLAESAQGSSAQALAEATAAYAVGVQAQADANTALANAAVAYNKAVGSLQPSAATIVNATNQMTAINTGGITVYSGSASSGARVVMNSVGIAGYDSSDNATFSILASTGAATFRGTVTGSNIVGSTLNIGGNFYVDGSTGILQCTGATITGTITSNNATITGGSLTVGSNFQVTSAGNLTASNANITGAITANSGSIGLFNIVGNSYLNYGTTYLYGGSNASGYCLLDTVKPINVAYVYAPSQTSTLYGISMSGGSLQMGTSSNFYNNPNNTTTATANAFLNSTSGFLARSTSSLRYKVEIKSQEIPVDSILSLEPKSYVDKNQYENNNQNSQGLQRYLGLIAEEVIQIPVIGEMLANKDNEGKPDSVNYDRVAVALIPLLKDLNNRVNKLEGK